MTRNEEIFLMKVDGYKTQDIAKKYNISTWRVDQIVAHFKALAAMGARRARIRAQCTMSKKWSLSELLDCLHLHKNIRKHIEEQTPNKQLTLFEFLDIFLPNRKAIKGLSLVIPLCNIPYATNDYRKIIIEQLQSCRFCDDYEDELDRRLAIIQEQRAFQHLVTDSSVTKSWIPD